VWAVVELSENGGGHRETDKPCVLDKKLGKKGHGEPTARRSVVQVDYNSVEVRLHGTEFHQNISFEKNTYTVWV
jgi:hypothetical protein